jgi:hypothetical protein
MHPSAHNAINLFTNYTISGGGMVICQHCGRGFEKGYIGGQPPKYCPTCKPTVAKERARQYHHDIKSGKRKYTRKLDMKLRNKSHYPWEKPTRCKCQMCENEGRDPYYTRTMHWTGRGMPHIRCDRHEQQVKELGYMPTIYQVGRGA